MGRLNRTALEPDKLIQIEGRLFNALQRREAGELESILRGLLTEAEIEMLSKRVELLRLLSDKFTNKKLVEELKLSTTTVSQTRSKLRYDKHLQKLVQDLNQPGS